MPKRNWRDWRVYVRDRCKCVYCGLDGRRDIRLWNQLVIDHLIPTNRRARGRDAPDNRVVSCNRCNTLKGSFDPLRDSRHTPALHVPRRISASARRRLVASARRYIQQTHLRHGSRDDFALMMREVRRAGRRRLTSA